MGEDFFTATAPYLASLNKTDRSIYDYVTQNLERVKDESIRTLSHECFVSTTTTFRFVQKLGFSGYADFINLLRLTYYAALEEGGSKRASSAGRAQEYMECIQETLGGLSDEKADTFAARFARARSVLLLSDDECAEAALYARRLFCARGRPAFVLQHGYELNTAQRCISRADMLLVLAFRQEQALVEKIRRLQSEHPAYLVALTGQKHSPLQALSDLSVYVAGGNGGQYFFGSLIAVIDDLARRCPRAEAAPERRD